MALARRGLRVTLIDAAVNAHTRRTTGTFDVLRLSDALIESRLSMGRGRGSLDRRPLGARAVLALGEAASARRALLLAELQPAADALARLVAAFEARTISCGW